MEESPGPVFTDGLSFWTQYLPWETTLAHPIHHTPYSPCHHFNPHIPFYTWDLCTDKHLSLTLPPQQRWPLCLHLSPFYTHTQQGQAESGLLLTPRGFFQSFIKCVCGVWHPSAVGCNLELFRTKSSNYFVLHKWKQLKCKSELNGHTKCKDFSEKLFSTSQWLSLFMVHGIQSSSNIPSRYWSDRVWLIVK